MYEKAPTDLRSHTKALLKPSATGIEIGGGFNPLITRKEGHIIHTIDHVSKEQLIEKYKDTVGLSPFSAISSMWTAWTTVVSSVIC